MNSFRITLEILSVCVCPSFCTSRKPAEILWTEIKHIAVLNCAADVRSQRWVMNSTMRQADSWAEPGRISNVHYYPNGLSGNRIYFIRKAISKVGD